MDQKTPVIKWKTLGHARQKLFFEKILGNRRLAHSYIFAGPAHIGKTATAIDLARALLCAATDESGSRPCEKCPVCRMPLGANPDFFLIDGREEIKIESIRNLQKNFSLKAFAGKYKLAIIAQAENFNSEAANALLKFLEEPAEHSVIILTASRPHSLPATILSRAQIIRFGKPDRPSVEKFYKARSDFPKILDLQNICGWRIGLAVSAIENPEFAEDFFRAVADFGQMRASDLQTRLFTSAELAEKESAELGELLNLWLLFLDAGAKNFSARNSFSVFARQAQALLDSSRYLKSNLNKKLVLDNLAIKL